MRSDLSTFLPTLGLLGAVLKKIRLRTHKKHQKTQKIYSKDLWHCTDRIVKILVEEIVPNFGVLESLLSDRGTNLLSHLMIDVCQLLGIHKLNTTAYHPQGDGLVERYNRTLKSMLRKNAARFGKEWTMGQVSTWSARNTPHEATGEKPSYLLFGVDLRSSVVTYTPVGDPESERLP